MGIGLFSPLHYRSHRKMLEEALHAEMEQHIEAENKQDAERAWGKFVAAYMQAL